MTKQKKTISVIIPAYNEEQVLPELLQDLKQQTFTDFETIIADADSTDATRQLAENGGCKVVDGGLPGVGRNRGAEAASGEYYFFLDADVRLDKKFIQSALAEMEAGNIRVAGCEAVPLSDLAVDRVIHKTAFLLMKMSRNTNPRLPGYCMFFHSDVFNSVGGFDEEVQVAEDYDLVRRAAEIAELQLLDSVQVYVSTRRFDKEGRIPYVGKGIKLFFHRTFKGEIKDGSIEYEFGAFDSPESRFPEKQFNKIEKQLQRAEKQLKKTVKKSQDVPAKISSQLNKTGEIISRFLSGNGEDNHDST